MRRESSQSHRTLHEHYLRLVGDPEVAEGGWSMVLLLDALPALAARYEVWGLTSLYTLVLLAEDDWRSPWWVRVSYDLQGHAYHVRYDLADGPWLVTGLAYSVQDALVRIETAMIRSGGWTAPA